jgi:hypothetical protein
VAQKVHVGIVLDRSGSMEDCRTDAIGAVNSYLRQVKGDKNTQASISLITFVSQSIEVIRIRSPSKSCVELASSEYQPRASTPLLDAVGHGVALLDKRKAAGERILTVMTDRLENASREYTKETIEALLGRKQKEEGWLVLYLGADHDAWAQASAMGLHAGNVAAFDKLAVGASMAAIGGRSKRYAEAVDGPARLYQAASPKRSAPACVQHESADRTKRSRSRAGFAAVPPSAYLQASGACTSVGSHRAQLRERAVHAHRNLSLRQSQLDIRRHA